VYERGGLPLLFIVAEWSVVGNILRRSTCNRLGGSLEDDTWQLEARGMEGCSYNLMAPACKRFPHVVPCWAWVASSGVWPRFGLVGFVLWALFLLLFVQDNFAL
jgi:hypothetical protein